MYLSYKSCKKDNKINTVFTDFIFDKNIITFLIVVT